VIHRLQLYCIVQCSYDMCMALAYVLLKSMGKAHCYQAKSALYQWTIFKPSGKSPTTTRVVQLVTPQPDLC